MTFPESFPVSSPGGTGVVADGVSWGDVMGDVRRVQRSVACLARDVEALMGGPGSVVSVVIEPGVWPGELAGVADPVPDELKGVALSWDAARRWLDYWYDPGFGSMLLPHNVRVWSDTHVGFVTVADDGCPRLARVPLVPSDASFDDAELTGLEQLWDARVSQVAEIDAALCALEDRLVSDPDAFAALSQFVERL